LTKEKFFGIIFIRVEKKFLINEGRKLMQEKENKTPQEDYIKMDFNLETVEERIQRINEIINSTPSEKLTSNYLEKMATYLIDVSLDKKKDKKFILTDNNMVTVNKREMSFEGLISKLENGEDGIYNMIANDKNIIFAPKLEISEEDIQEIPGMKELREKIKEVEILAKAARGKRAFILKKELIAMRKDQYVLRSMYRKPIRLMNLKKSIAKINLDEKVYLDEKEEVHSTGLINLYDPQHVSLLLCHYAQLKEDAWDNLNGDIKWLIVDLENAVDAALKEDYPLYYDLVIYKIDGLSNLQIQQKLNEKYNIKHSVEYISSLWRNKIPKLIAEKAANDWLIWHFTYENPENAKWKKCSKCGQIKLAHNHFFSKNNTSKDHYYSICKKCRNSKSKKMQPKN
jgi:hypothetical protein